MRAHRSSVAVALAAATAVTAVAGCAAKNEGKGGGKGAIEVTATDSSCELSAKEFPPDMSGSRSRTRAPRSPRCTSTRPATGS